MNNRISWDEYFLRMAYFVAERSTCLRRHVGAVAVRDHHVLATGYNGPPSGFDHCDRLGGCLREERGIKSGTDLANCRATHAEQNLIVQAARHGTSLQGCTVYCTHQPCSVCAKLLVGVGVSIVIYAESYPDKEALEILYKGNVGQRHVEIGGNGQ